MLIYFEPSIALLTYGLAFIISILPTSLVKRLPNLLLTLFDFSAIGAGNLMRKQYLTTFFYFIISLIIIFLISFSKYYFIHSDTFLRDDQISFIANGAVVLATVIFVLLQTMSREVEMNPEQRIASLEQLEKSYQDTAFKQLGVHLPKSFISPPGFEGSASSLSLSTNRVGETREEQERLDREWQEEVERIHRDQEEREREEEDARQLEESFRSLEDDY